MKYLILTIAFMLVSCDNQTVQRPNDEPDSLGTDMVATDDLVTDILDEPEGGTDDDWLAGVPNTLPDTTVATCGNGVVDEGEECDGSVLDQEGLEVKKDCFDLDAEIYTQGIFQTSCGSKWCRWDRNSCYLAEKKFECPQGYSGADCKKCASLFQDSDHNGTCEPACSSGGKFLFTCSDPMDTACVFSCGLYSANEMTGCEYFDGKPVCSCEDGHERDEAGSCTLDQ